MRSRGVTWRSIGLNVLVGLVMAIVGGLLVAIFARQNRPYASGPSNPATTNAPLKIKTNVVVRRQGFQWSEIESTNYPVFIRNLRLIGCPEKTIRDIIVAEVNDLFTEKMNTEVVAPEQKWWLPDPNADVYAAVSAQMRALEDQKNALLTELLGPGWTNTVPRQVAPIRLDGPVLSKLSPQTKSSLFEIEGNATRAREAYIQHMQAEGKEPDSAALAKMRRQVRSDLAALLTPEQLEEYLLRYSQNSEQLREQLRGFGAGPEEYRRIFRARDAYDQQLDGITGSDEASLKRRADLEHQRDQAVEQAIGADRFSLYQLTLDPSFKEARESAQENGLPPEKVLPLFQINRATEQEISRIQSDQRLTQEEKDQAIKRALEQKLASSQQVIGKTQEKAQ
jgi:hypothetical protein